MSGQAYVRARRMVVVDAPPVRTWILNNVHPYVTHETKCSVCGICLVSGDEIALLPMPNKIDDSDTRAKWENGGWCSVPADPVHASCVEVKP